MRGGVSLPLRSAIIEVLRHFNVVPFQFTLNSFCIMVTFFIAFLEVGISEPHVNQFSYMYVIKALTEHEGFWYTTKRGTDIEGICGLRNNMG